MIPSPPRCSSAYMLRGRLVAWRQAPLQQGFPTRTLRPSDKSDAGATTEAPHLPNWTRPLLHRPPITTWRPERRCGQPTPPHRRPVSSAAWRPSARPTAAQPPGQALDQLHLANCTRLSPCAPPSAWMSRPPWCVFPGIARQKPKLGIRCMHKVSCALPVRFAAFFCLVPSLTCCVGLATRPEQPPQRHCDVATQAHATAAGRK